MADNLKGLPLFVPCSEAVPTEFGLDLGCSKSSIARFILSSHTIAGFERQAKFGCLTGQPTKKYLCLSI